jgi:hypothetical protein
MSDVRKKLTELLRDEAVVDTILAQFDVEEKPVEAFEVQLGRMIRHRGCVAWQQESVAETGARLLAQLNAAGYEIVQVGE